MRKLLFVGLAFIGLVTVAQEQEITEQDSIPAGLAKKIFVYNSSKLYNDPLVQRMAVYDLLAENPSNIALRDTLALIYLQQQMFASAALVSQEVANAAPDDMFATEIAALSFERLGVKAKALGYYEKLYLNNPEDINRLYKMAFLQLDLKLFEEALASTSQLVNHQLAEETTLVFPTEDGVGQEVSMILAAKRLKGMVQEAKGNKTEAISIFESILAEKAEFEVVKNQLTLLKQ